MTKGKAYNRFQREKRVKKWTKLVSKQFDNVHPDSFVGGQNALDRRRAKNISRAVRTPTPCSCYMCRNARQSEGATLREKRQMARQFDEDSTE